MLKKKKIRNVLRTSLESSNVRDSIIVVTFIAVMLPMYFLSLHFFPLYTFIYIYPHNSLYIIHPYAKSMEHQKITLFFFCFVQYAIKITYTNIHTYTHTKSML